MDTMVNNTPRTVLVTMVGSIEERECARLLVDSLRSFGGVLGQCPVWIFEADRQNAPCDTLAQAGVEICLLTVPDTLRRYPLAGKVCAGAQAEAQAAPDCQSLIWLNPECLIVQPPVLLDLAPAYDLAIRPVHIRNVGMPAGMPLDDFWKGIYAAVGLDDTALTVESFADAQRIRAYFNTHAFAVNPSKGLFRRWLDCFEALVGDPEFQSRACQDERHRIFLHQAVLSALIAATLVPERIHLLPPEYSYPYNLHPSIPPERRAARLNDLVCVVYEERSLAPDAVEDIDIHEPLRSWLSAHISQNEACPLSSGAKSALRGECSILNWLLEENNPGVRVRALTELCGLSSDHDKVRAARRLAVQTLDAARDLSWMELKGLWLIYHLTALAESGLSREDVPIDPVVDGLLSLPFDASCGDMMALRALAMLGYADDGRVQERLAQLVETQLPDGGWLCLHRVRKMDRTPKSCIKAAMHGLLLAGELAKRGLSFAGSGPLVGYFLKRRLFYRTDDPTRLVLDCRPGWRMTDVFFPIEVQRVGLPVLLDALAALGAGPVEELQDAWRLLDGKRDAQGRVLLEGTLAKSYLPKERVGKPSKWGTLYAHLAWARRSSPPR